MSRPTVRHQSGGTYVSPRVAEELTGTPEPDVRTLIGSGAVRAERVRGKVLVRLEDVEAAARRAAAERGPA
jgi:hypothetical protein